eukprot:CAMPEP_0177660644 /NCGR_PEP_ID=MMETSP0447-20121125/18164_1 /TAXON_ID=0 /ORGANISM="Stygamoeba regulata, Strain BSH-02190019" /LENGTH=405 /DNA_ID=CAMNT_0019165751 /DNA_START=19 /DNA_END=1237 /DNA_ORIENTATION=-
MSEGKTVACVLETGQAHFINAFTYEDIRTVVLTADTISTAHLSLSAHLWCACPNTLDTMTWRLSSLLSTTTAATSAPTYVRILSEGAKVRTESGSKRMVKVAQGCTPLMIDCIASRPFVTILGCTGVLVLLNPDLQIVSTANIERQYGRITAISPCLTGVLLGTLQGMVLWEGSRRFTMQTRVLQVIQLEGQCCVCLGYDGSLVLLDERTQPIMEKKLQCGNSTFVYGGLHGGFLVYGLRDGSVHRHEFRHSTDGSVEGSNIEVTASINGSVEGSNIEVRLKHVGIDSNPMIERAWCFLEMLVAKSCKGTKLEMFLRKMSTEQPPREAIKSLFQVSAVSHQLPMVLELLCFYFQGIRVDETLKCLEEELGYTTCSNYTTQSERLRDIVTGLVKHFVKHFKAVHPG